MKKQITEYMEFIESELKRLDNSREKDLDELAKLNQQMIEDFRHERFVHLIITLFFALMAIVWFIVTLGLMWMGPSEYVGTYMVILLGVLTLLFLVVDAFYIRHYYFLENNIQKLYGYNEKIYSLKTKE